MIPGDYVERSRIAKSGKIVTDRIVKSSTGVEYAIGPVLGRGGVAAVFRARRVSDQKECVFKEYVPDPLTVKQHKVIKRNILKLMNTPLTEDDGHTKLSSFIGPMDKDSFIPLPSSKGFGYIMELVDTSVFLNLPKLWHNDTYPDAVVKCTILKNLSYFFRRVHLAGWCYKDINEGNIYFNSVTGEVRIIDCDNISIQSERSIKGTNGYMAPEVYDTDTPDTYTDYFSMAVLFYRLCVGGFPLDGKKTQDYLIKHNKSVIDAGPDIYGKMALFAFDPKDKSNEIRGLVDLIDPKLYKTQVLLWDALPTKLQNAFIKTFSEGLAVSKRYSRTSDYEWMSLFDDLLANNIVKCKCGKANLGDPNKAGLCPFCDAKIKPMKRTTTVLNPTPQPPRIPSLNPAPQPTVNPIPKPAPTARTGTELTKVTFTVKRDIEPRSFDIIAKRSVVLPAKNFCSDLNDGWMKLQYKREMNALGAVNKSNYTWIVTYKGVKNQCGPGGRVVLKKGMIITVISKRLQLTVNDIG